MNKDLLVAVYKTLSDLIVANEQEGKAFYELPMEERKDAVVKMQAKVDAFRGLKKLYVLYKESPTKELEGKIVYNYSSYISKYYVETEAKEVKSTLAVEEEVVAEAKEIKFPPLGEEKSVEEAKEVKSAPTEESIDGEEKKSIAEWERIYGWKVVNPIGFGTDVFNPGVVISEKEFQDGIAESEVENIDSGLGM